MFLFIARQAMCMCVHVCSYVFLYIDKNGHPTFLCCATAIITLILPLKNLFANLNGMFLRTISNIEINI